MIVNIKLKLAAGIGRELGLKREMAIPVPQNLIEALAQIELVTGLSLLSKVGKGLTILINGESIYKFIKKNTLIQNGDVIMVVPILGGG